MFEKKFSCTGQLIFVKCMMLNKQKDKFLMANHQRQILLRLWINLLKRFLIYFLVGHPPFKIPSILGTPLFNIHLLITYFQYWVIDIELGLDKAWVFPVPRVQAQAFFDLPGFFLGLGFSWTTGLGSGQGQ